MVNSEMLIHYLMEHLSVKYPLRSLLKFLNKLAFPNEYHFIIDVVIVRLYNRTILAFLKPWGNFIKNNSHGPVVPKGTLLTSGWRIELWPGFFRQPALQGYIEPPLLPLIIYLWLVLHELGDLLGSLRRPGVVRNLLFGDTNPLVALVWMPSMTRPEAVCSIGLAWCNAPRRRRRMAILTCFYKTS